MAKNIVPALNQNFQLFQFSLAWWHLALYLWPTDLWS